MKTYHSKLPIVVGFSAIFVMVGSLGAWSLCTEIAGAVVARGTVQVESGRQVIQHPDGGVVKDILAQDGDIVAAGDVVIRLDDTFLRSELATVEGQLAEVFVRRARLIAERDDAEEPLFDQAPRLPHIGEDVLRDQIAGQRNLFEVRRASLAKEGAQLQQQQVQIRRQIDGTLAQHAAVLRQQVLIDAELADVRFLFDKGLVSRARLLDLERDSARIAGDLGDLTARMAEAEARLSAIEIERLNLTDLRREEAITRLRDISYSQIELDERRQNLLERIARLDVRAPMSGVVFESRIAAVRSVVRPADPMMFIVPADQPLEVSTRLDPKDIDQVYAGQTVSLMFTAFNSRAMPEIPGRVVGVSADVQTDESTGTPYYEAIVAPVQTDIFAAADWTLLPGMQVDIFMRTDMRSPLSYLTEPLSAYLHRAFREQ